MNYLAHILLSGPDPEWQLGGFLGDFVKGPLPAALPDKQGNVWSPGVRSGIQLHRQLDAYVDSHPQYLSCLEALGTDYRRVGGIALDVFFDHLLVRHWTHFSDVPLPEFSQSFYELCAMRHERLPESAARFIRRAAANDLFQGYGREEMFLPVLERIDQRIRFETNLLPAGQAVLAQYSELERGFLQLMPQLADKAAELRR
ncbi:ACP phosphodiesterase [Pseudomaricurvus sp.]|uniref:acyl carrier protein phosphodiesterase n=1 Tax=Pseudomaricurvus sp. TaxID=2004510 RepID=UPI003F6B061E